MRIRRWVGQVYCKNYGSMFNRGVELSLQSVNIQNKNFTWGTNLMFSYNKNELTNLEGTKRNGFFIIVHIM